MTMERVLYVIVCAAPPASEVQALVKRAASERWDVHVIATPAALQWLDQQGIEELSGNPVRSEFRLPGEGKSLPQADVIAVAPATFNTVNKFRFGIADNMALGILCECLRAEVPIVIAPNVKAVLAGHPAFGESLRVLEAWGVHVMEQSPEPRGERMASWNEILELASRLA